MQMNHYEDKIQESCSLKIHNMYEMLAFNDDI